MFINFHDLCHTFLQFSSQFSRLHFPSISSKIWCSQVFSIHITFPSIFSSPSILPCRSEVVSHTWSLVQHPSTPSAYHLTNSHSFPLLPMLSTPLLLLILTHTHTHTHTHTRISSTCLNIFNSKSIRYSSDVFHFSVSVSVSLSLSLSSLYYVTLPTTDSLSFLQPSHS